MKVKYVILICLYCECKCQNVDLYSVIYMSSRDNLLIENVLKNIFCQMNSCFYPSQAQKIYCNIA